MNKLTLMLLFLFSFSSFATEMSGEAHIESNSIKYNEENEENEENGELREVTFIINGAAAKEMYDSIKSEAWFDECEGVTKKRVGDFKCYITNQKEYSCVFTLNLQHQKLSDLEC